MDRFPKEEILLREGIGCLIAQGEMREVACGGAAAKALRQREGMHRTTEADVRKLLETGLAFFPPYATGLRR
jgi:hypothetical protein